jgi:oligoendopeptidase F
LEWRASSLNSRTTPRKRPPLTATDTNWDLSSFFPAPGSSEHRDFVSALSADVAAARRRAAEAAPLDTASQDTWEELACTYEDIVARRTHVGAFVECLTALDASHDGYRRAEAELTDVDAELSKLRVELRRGLGAASEPVFASFCQRARLRPIEYPLRRLRTEARQTMGSELEGLAADLGKDGLSAWGRLYGQVAGTLAFDMREPDGSLTRVPMARRRSLMADADRERRRAAFEGGNVAWADAAKALGPALNHIAGIRLTLNARRGVNHFLDVALFQSAISRATLDAMWTAVEACRDVPLRGLQLKARALGLAALDWYDLEAPFPLPSAQRFDWPTACARVQSAFGHAYPRLAAFFDSALERRWVEYEPREHKLPGAFCTWSTLSGEPRVFMSFDGSLGDVTTLAHEIGHAFHATLLGDLRSLVADAPMTLAETASTFAQQLATTGLLADPGLDDGTRMLLLGTVVNELSAFCLDIPTRFEFERSFHEERAQGEVSVARLSELMLAAQEKSFGAVLGRGDPLYWVSKPHFFATDVTFYNFPYTFGYLLSRGLYAALEREGSEFLGRYEALLAATGQGDAQDVVRSIAGFELETPDFWQTAIRSFDAELDQLEALLPKLGL